MPTPVGPAPPDPDDPDTWDWGDDGYADYDDAAFPRRQQPWRLLVVGVVVVGLVLLLLASVL